MSTTKGLAAGDIQTAIYALLAADTTLRGLVGTRIYDAVPDSTTDDYVAIGEFTESTDDTLEDGDQGIGSDCTVTIHGYTDDAKGAGYKRVQAIASRVKLLVHNASLNVAGWALVECQHEDTAILRDYDEASRPKRHSVSTFRVIVEGA